MDIKNHSDYQEESKRLKYTEEIIEETIERIEENKEKYQQDMKQAMVDLDYLDSSQSYITILTTSQFLKMDQNQYEKLIRSRGKPYFARIDFKATDLPVKKYYLGKLSLMNDKEQDPLIIDWRSPIANVYYEGRLGHMSYPVPKGVIEGELLLKRQLTIKDGVLTDLVDIDITTNDAFLQASLEAKADNRLKDIAETIQAEQNKVIRADITGPLIVQGVAGSGKTTIALHRVAYLIYTYDDQFIPENFMIMAPNSLFINYISEVLPELGVERINQTTYIDFVFELIGKKYKLVDPNKKLMKLINPIKGTSTELLKNSSELKGSMAYKNLIDQYITHIETSFLPEEDFALEGYIVYTYKDIKRLFIEEYNFIPLYKRLPLIKKVLNNKLKTIKVKIVEKIEDKYNKEIEQIRYSREDCDETRAILIELADLRDRKLKEIKGPANTLIKKYMNNFKYQDLFQHYWEFLSSEKHGNHATQSGKQEVLSYLSQYTKELLAQSQVELEDLPALTYLKYRLFGLDEKIDVNHVVIDEAQDFSVFQFYTLKTILNTNLFTILGDLSQGVHSYRGTRDWQEVIEQVFPDDECQFHTLEQSYRTTVEIMNLANEIIKQLNINNTILAKPVIRHGEKPFLAKFKSIKDIIPVMIEKIEILGPNYKSMAIICKTMDDCKLVKQNLSKLGIKVEILTGNEKEYSSGLVIVPSYIAKGLEFDIVFIVNIHDIYTQQELDIKLLYVAMTRAMHKLYIYHLEGTLPILDKVTPSFIEI